LVVYSYIQIDSPVSAFQQCSRWRLRSRSEKNSRPRLTDGAA
jgi:hypothetical protein